MDGHLGAGMDGKDFKLLPQQTQDANILHYDRIGAGIAQELQVLACCFKFGILYQCIHSHIGLNTSDMRIIDRRFDFFIRKI